MFATPQATVIKYLVIFAVIFGAGFASAWKLQEANINQILIDDANDKIAALESQAKSYQRQINELSKISADYHQKMEEIKSENKKLRDSTNPVTGTKRVYIHVKEPCTAMPEATLPSRTSREYAELSEDARQNILDLRDASGEVMAQLDLCKASLWELTSH